MWLGDDCQRNLECLALWRIIQITIHIGTDKNLISKFVWISTFSINSSPMLSTYSFLTIHLLPFPLVARRCRRRDPPVLTSVCVMGSERYVVCECERKHHGLLRHSALAYWLTGHNSLSQHKSFPSARTASPCQALTGQVLLTSLSQPLHTKSSNRWRTLNK